MADDDESRDRRPRAPRQDPWWPEVEGGHPITELMAPTQGSPSPFGETRVPAARRPARLRAPGHRDQPLSTASPASCSPPAAAGGWVGPRRPSSSTASRWWPAAVRTLRDAGLDPVRRRARRRPAATAADAAADRGHARGCPRRAGTPRARPPRCAPAWTRWRAPTRTRSLVALVDTPGIGPAALRPGGRARDRPRRPGPRRGRRPARGTRCCSAGRTGRRCAAAAARATPARGASCAGRDDVVAVEIGDVAVPDDLDTPEDLARWTRETTTGRGTP